MTEEPTKDFCARHGISKMTLSRWRRAGRVVVTASGQIDAEASDERLRNASLGAFRLKRGEPSADLADAQRRREIALARLRRQDWDRRSAEWTLREDAAALWRKAARCLFHAMEPLPKAAAERVMACRTAAVTQSALRDVVHDALAEASRGDDEPAAATSSPTPGILNSATKLEAETAKVDALALLRQLDADIAAGAVVSVALVARTIGAAYARVRQRLLALPAELPPHLVGRSPEKVLEMLVAAVAEALAELPAELPLPGLAAVAAKVVP